MDILLTQGQKCDATINGTAHSYASTDINLTYDNTIVIFGVRVGTLSKTASKFWYFRAEKDGTLVRNLVPAKRTSDNAIGMYDTVTDTFFTNADTGTFTAGDPVSDPVEIYTDGTTETVEVDTTGDTATAEMLLAVGDYKDTQDVLNGAVTRNLKVLVLDGVTTGKKMTNAWNSTYKRGNIIIPDFGGGDAPIADSLCSHFKYNSNVNISPTEAGFCTRSYDKLILFSFLGLYNVTSYQTANDWLADQYANGTPVIIVYPLATPTTEQVTPQPLAGSSATVTAGSIDNLPIESSTIAELKKRYIGDNEVNRVYIGDNLVWENN